MAYGKAMRNMKLVISLWEIYNIKIDGIMLNGNEKDSFKYCQKCQKTMKCQKNAQKFCGGAKKAYLCTRNCPMV